MGAGQLAPGMRWAGQRASTGLALKAGARGAFVLPVTERATGSGRADRSFSCDFLKEISSGSLGSVWLGRIASGNETGRLVTVRRVPLADLSASEQRAIKAAARLSTTLVHPSLVKVLRAYEQGGDLLVVGEHIDGVHLGVLRRLAADADQPLSIVAAVRIVLDILRASVGARVQMATGRQRRLVYVEGALVARFGETLLSDVGVLGELANSGRARLDVELATQLAPEELLGGPSDERAEVFAIGVLLWELVANRRLFPASSFAEARGQLIRCEVPELTSIESAGLKMPAGLSQVIARATAREPQARFLTVHALLKALSALAPDRAESEREVRLCVERMAGPFLAACRRSADLPAVHQTDETDVPWVTPTVRPARSSSVGFPSEESPTVPDRRLVRPERVSIPVSLPTHPSPLPPVTVVSTATSMQGPALESAAASLATDLAPPKRPRWAAAGAAAVLALGLIVGLLLFSRADASLSPAPERVSTAPQPGRSAAAEDIAPRPSAGRQAPGLARDTADTDAVSEPASHGYNAPPDLGAHASLATGPDAGTQDSGTSPSTAGSDTSKGSPSRRTFRPRSIEPYRPRGI
jgi:hypothetical protein